MPLIEYVLYMYCSGLQRIKYFYPKAHSIHEMRTHRKYTGRGYALFEALIAVLVASIGFIGAARLQTLGMKINTSAQLRQKAVLLVYQMSDRVRANRTGFGAGAYNNPGIGSKSCLSTGCTPADLAVADMTEWSEDIKNQLQGGSGVVCIDSTPNDGMSDAPECDGIGSKLTIKIWWPDTLGNSRFVAEIYP